MTRRARRRRRRRRGDRVNGVVSRQSSVVSDLDHGHPEGRQEPHLVALRTSRRSLAPWRWSRLRGCGAPSSGSRRCGPYARAIRRMTRRTVEAAENIPNLPLLEEHDNTNRVGLLLVTGDRGLAGAFNSQILRAGNRRAQELRDEGKEVVWFASGRRGVSSLQFRGREVAGDWAGFTDRPAFSNARDIASEVATAVRGREGRPGRDHLQRLRVAAHAERPHGRAAAAPGDGPAGGGCRGGGGRGRRGRPERGVRRRPRRVALRARAGGDPAAPGSRLHRDQRSSGRCWSRRRPSTARA